MTSPFTVTDEERLAAEAPRLIALASATGAAYADLFAETSLHERRSVRVRLDARRRLAPPRYRAVTNLHAGAAVRALTRSTQCQVWCPAPEGRSLPDLPDLRKAARTAAERLSTAADLSSVPLDPNAPHVWPPVGARGAGEAGHARAFFERLTDAAFAAHPRVVELEASLRTHHRRTCVFTAEAAPTVVERMISQVQVRVFVASRGRRHPGTAFADDHTGEPEVLARHAVAMAVRHSEARPLRPGRMPLVVAPGWGGIWLHEAVGHPREADRVHPKEASRPASRLVSVFDDGRVPEGRASASVDDEGVSTARTGLIDGGRATGVLTDRFHAHALGLPLTGNGRRQDYRTLPLPRMTNLILESGSDEPEALIAAVQDGLYVSEFSRGRYDPRTNLLRLEVREARRIAGGRFQEFVTPVQVVARPEELLAGVRGVANDLALEAARGTCRKRGQIVPVSVGAPTVLFEPLEVRPVKS